MRAFVTGATGFVGSHVAQQLAAQGAELRLLVRSTSRRENLEGLGGELVTGDLGDVESLRKGMAGCEFVFHVAADYRLWTPDPKPMYASNVGGTENVIRAAQQSGARRVIYCSTVATMGFKYEPVVVDEDTPVSEREMVGHYKRSKFLAEQKALEMAQAGARVIVVNPSAPIGERDIKPTPTGKIVVDFLHKRFPAYVDTGLNIVDVRDVARGHLLAMEKGRDGQRYILGGDNMTLKEVLDTLRDLTGLPSPNVKVPHFVALTAAVFDEAINGRMLGREPRATVETVQMGRKKMWVKSDKSERELGYTHGPAREALRRAAEWFVAHGYAPAYAEKKATA